MARRPVEEAAGEHALVQDSLDANTAGPTPAVAGTRKGQSDRPDRDQQTKQKVRSRPAVKIGGLVAFV